MKNELIEIKAKLLIASKYIRQHRDAMAADEVIEFCIGDINRMLEEIERKNTIIELINNGTKKVLRLDKNFHVYIHGSLSNIDMSQDLKGKFVKLYYEKLDE